VGRHSNKCEVATIDLVAAAKAEWLVVHDGVGKELLHSLADNPKSDYGETFFRRHSLLLPIADATFAPALDSVLGARREAGSNLPSLVLVSPAKPRGLS